MKKFLFLIYLSLITAFQGYAAQPIELLPPDLIGGKPLMMALNERKSSRAFSECELSLDVLSNLLWAACGVNRSDGKRTAPTAGNFHEIGIYVAMKNGAYL